MQEDRQEEESFAVGFRVSKELRDWLFKEAARTDRSVSAVLRRMVAAASKQRGGVA